MGKPPLGRGDWLLLGSADSLSPSKVAAIGGRRNSSWEKRRAAAVVGGSKFGDSWKGEGREGSKSSLGGGKVSTSPSPFFAGIQVRLEEPWHHLELFISCRFELSQFSPLPPLSERITRLSGTGHSRAAVLLLAAAC